MAYNNSRQNNNRQKNSNNGPDLQAIIQKQKVSLAILNDVADFLDGFVKGSNFRLGMKDVIGHLNTKSYDESDMKIISQFTYLLIDIAKSHRIRNITPERITLRREYIVERLNCYMRPELKSDVEKLIEDHAPLFYGK